MPYKDPKDPRRIEKQRAWIKANPEKVKANTRRHAEKNREGIRKRQKEWVKANLEKSRSYKAKWSRNNKAARAADVVKRKIVRRRGTPIWLTEDDHWMIKEAYDLAALRTKMLGFQWHVDHIVPLQGKTVSGLHVPSNLQVIPWIDNCKKSNKL